EVMSPKPIPDWSAGPRPAPQRGGSLFDFQVEECISSDEPLTPCPELDVPIAIEGVYRALKGLGSSTAPGPDGISSGPGAVLLPRPFRALYTPSIAMGTSSSGQGVSGSSEEMHSST